MSKKNTVKFRRVYTLDVLENHIRVKKKVVSSKDMDFITRKATKEFGCNLKGITITNEIIEW